MKKSSLGIMLLLLAVAPALAIGQEKQTPEKSEFSFSIDTIAGPEFVEFELTLQNHGNGDLLFEFPTSKKYEIIVMDGEKKKVYQFSEDKAFAQAFEKLEVKPHETIKWRESWDYNQAGIRIKEGEYSVNGQLEAISVNGKPVANKQQLTDQKQMYIPGENPVFKGIKTDGQSGSYKISGEARPTSGKFFYTIEDGHNQLIAETKVIQQSKYPNWHPFSLKVAIPENKLPQNGSLILTLYERSKDGKIIHTYPVLLERFPNK